jgi:hypothetical protein
VRSAVEAPPVVLPLLERADARLRSGFGFGADDVAWEAHWSGAGAPGWALSFGPGVDMAAVRRAVRAGLGPLRGAVVDPADRLVASALPTRGPVWGSDPRWARLVPAGGEAFVLRRECLSPADLPGPARAAERSLALLQPLVGFAVTFGDHVATVRVDRGRTDLFARVGAARRWPVGGAGDPTFGGVFRHGVADPSSGRIGYDVPRPRAAAALVRRDLLPFGVCAPPA